MQQILTGNAPGVIRPRVQLGGAFAALLEALFPMPRMQRHSLPDPDHHSDLLMTLDPLDAHPLVAVQSAGQEGAELPATGSDEASGDG